MRSLTKRAVHAYDLVVEASVDPPPTPGTEEVFTFPFTFATPTQQLGAFVAGALVIRASLLITTPFDDVAATASFGVAAIPTEFLGAIDVNRAGQYGSDAITITLVPEVFLFTLTPGASTQGEGLLLWAVKNP